MKIKIRIYSYLFCVLMLISFLCLASSCIDRVSEIGYYSSIYSALSDAHSSVIENADSDSASAAASLKIYESGRCELNMLKDTSLACDLLFSCDDLIFNLNGKTLDLEGYEMIVSSGRLTVNGSCGEIVNTSEKESACGIIASARESIELTVNDLNISVSAVNKALGIACTEDKKAYITLNNCSITAMTDARVGKELTAAFFTNPDTNVNLKINGGTYIADTKHRLIDPETGASNTVGIRIQQKGGEVYLYDVRAIGIHSGISTSADMVLKNSYCASPTHGGMYNSGVLIAENTIFENIVYSGKSDSRDEISKAPRLGAMYNGGRDRNATAYLDNCQFINGDASYGLVISTNYGYKSPSAYISNTTVKDLRVDGERSENSDVIATAYIGENTAYTLSSADGIIDAATYKNVRFDEKWAKANKKQTE